MRHQDANMKESIIRMKLHRNVSWIADTSRKRFHSVSMAYLFLGRSRYGNVAQNGVFVLLNSFSPSIRNPLRIF
ncbi:unnamed protein product [Lactuca saligna]|uniref:Uncharacterized protein n=1 Tax=Lactuca saligna TaxID=75948 RepID=A0AA35VVB6_LACSI|nr:unnamed protein product [Lactuca saligna]